MGEAGGGFFANRRSYLVENVALAGGFQPMIVCPMSKTNRKRVARINGKSPIWAELLIPPELISLRGSALNVCAWADPTT
jgi:hypothetical protein